MVETGICRVEAEVDAGWAMVLDRVAMDLETEWVIAAVFWMSEVRGKTGVVSGEDEEDVVVERMLGGRVREDEELESVVALIAVPAESALLTTTSVGPKDESLKDEVEGRVVGAVEFSPDEDTACQLRSRNR